MDWLVFGLCNGVGICVPCEVRTRNQPRLAARQHFNTYLECVLFN